MNRYCGFNPLRYGDLFINLAACRILKQLDPGSHLTFVINGNYRAAAPFFLDQPDIDKIHITSRVFDGFDDTDWEWVKTQKFNHVFNPMQDHLDMWWFHRNQSLECAHMHGLSIPASETGKLSLNRWFNLNEDFKEWVAIQAFAGSYDSQNKKQLSPARAQEIVDVLVNKGYRVLQLGLESEYKLNQTVRIPNNYFDMIRDMLSCRLLITTDSGTSWAASCYDLPTLGLYSHEYYSKEYVKNIQPINPNAIYLDEENVNQISMESIEGALSKLL